jgi:hypothetical protein
MKPTWHTGIWTQDHTENLVEELQQAQLTRSLTSEEQEWLAQNEL